MQAFVSFLLFSFKRPRRNLHRRCFGRKREGGFAYQLWFLNFFCSIFTRYLGGIWLWMLQEHVTLHQDEDFFFCFGAWLCSGFHDTRGVMGGMLAGYQTKSFSTGSDSDAFLCCLLYFIFFLFPTFVVYWLAFQASPFLCSHWHWEDFDGMGLLGWGGIVYDNSFFFVVCFARFSCSFLDLILFITFVNLVFLFVSPFTS